MYVCLHLDNQFTLVPYLATEEQPKFYLDMVKKIQVVYSEFKGAILPEESVKAVLRVVNEATQKDTGAFIPHEGNKEWV